jgi:NAD(P)-dependent dehydrogenase (short-subunit alcohol dehydrogenase family)
MSGRMTAAMVCSREVFASVVVFLCRDDAAYITGADIAVNGGLRLD